MSETAEGGATRGKGWLRLPRFGLLSRRLAASVVVGLLAGLGAAAFYYLMSGSLTFFLGALCRYLPLPAGGESEPFRHFVTPLPEHPHRWLMLIMPALGGLVSGWLAYTFAPEAEGHGTDAAILAFHRLGGRIRARVPLIKALASAITIGTGGCGGPEGPMSQIGAGCGSALATYLGLSDRDRRLLMLAGLGAGLGAVFRAPLAGAIFAAEVLYKEEELEYEALLPATVAAIVAYAVFASLVTRAPVFTSPAVDFLHPGELLGYILLGIVSAAGGWLFIRCFYGMRDLFHKLPIQPRLRPAVGGLATGIVGFFLPAVLATNYGHVQRALNHDPSATVLFLTLLGLAKILCTSLSIGSGGAGGVFGPAVVIGGCFGGATGLLCYRWHLVSDPSAMVLVGMAGLFAGAANTPLSTIIMVSEMTGNYNLLVPCMCTVTIARVLLRGNSLFEKQVRNRQASPAHTGELAIDLLQALTVGEWMNRHYRPIHSELPLTELIREMADAEHTRRVVIDSAGRPVGVIDVRDVLCVVGTQTAQVTAATVMDPHFTTILPNRNLHQALALLDQDPHGLLIVTGDGAEPHRVVGVLRRQDVLHAYHNAGEWMLQSVHRTETGALHLPADLTVGEAMTVDIETVPPDLPASALAARLRATGHHGLPVVERGRLIGMVTLSDLEAAGGDLDRPVGDLCTRHLVTCFPYETLVEALRKFGEKQVGRLPVVDPADPAHLVGLLRRGDVVDTFAQAVAVEAEGESAVVHALDVPQSRFLEFTIRPESHALGQRIRELGLPEDCLVVSVRRGPRLLVPHGATLMERGDRVTVLCALSARVAAEACFGPRAA